MRKFIGKVNGVEYTDEKSFNDAVLEAIKEGSYSISSEYIDMTGAGDAEETPEIQAKDKNPALPKVDFSKLKVTDEEIAEAIDNNDYYALRGKLITRRDEISSAVSSKEDTDKLATLASEYEKQVTENIKQCANDREKTSNEIKELYDKINVLKSDLSKMSTHESYLVLVQNYYHQFAKKIYSSNKINTRSVFGSDIYNDLNSMIKSFWF